jgi:hypothetical protein
MVECGARSCESTARQRLHALLSGRSGLTFVFQGQHQNALEAAHIDQVEAECAGARGLQALGRVALG